MKQICLRYIKGTGRFEHFYQLFLVIFWQLSGRHCHSQHISRWLSEAQGTAARHFGPLPGGLACLARSVMFAKAKCPHFAVPLSMRGLQVKKLLSLNASCKDREKEHFLNLFLVILKLLTRSFWIADKKVLTVMLEIQPLALGLNLDRDFPDLTAYLVHADCPLQLLFVIFLSTSVFLCRKLTAKLGGCSFIQWGMDLYGSHKTFKISRL